MIKFNKNNTGLYVSLGIAVFLNIVLWSYSNKLYIKWTNVPPAPSVIGIGASFLDDKALAYRSSSLALQNFGNIGQAQNLNNYDYETLGKWFMLLDKLDPHSNFVPYLAAYYFGAASDGKKLPAVIEYLEEVGTRPGPGKWRWLVQAIYLSRHKMDNIDEALRLSKKLGSIYKPPMPLWTRNMQSMILSDMGDRQTAYLLMLEILKSDGRQMSASEYRSSITMICESILIPAEAAKSPLCQK